MIPREVTTRERFIPALAGNTVKEGEPGAEKPSDLIISALTLPGAGGIGATLPGAGNSRRKGDNMSSFLCLGIRAQGVTWAFSGRR